MSQVVVDIEEAFEMRFCTVVAVVGIACLVISIGLFIYTFAY